MSIYAQHGPLIRLVYLLVALLWWLGSEVACLLRGGRRGMVVLCYHGIRDEQRQRFAWQMAHVADRAIDAVGIEKVWRLREARRRVCVTFDDGFANLLRNALPIMQQLEVPATIFAVPGNLETAPHWAMTPGHPEADEPVMSVRQISRSQSQLCRFGSHTLTHADLTSLPAAQLQEQLVQSRCQLEHILQGKVEDLALPYGAYSAQVLAAARAAGYKRVFTLDPCLQLLGPGVIGRFSMTPDVWHCEFRLTCAGAYAWLGPWLRFVRHVRCRRQVRHKKEPALV